MVEESAHPSVPESRPSPGSLYLYGSKFAGDLNPRGLIRLPGGRLDFSPQKIAAIRRAYIPIADKLKQDYRDEGSYPEDFYVQRKGFLRVFGKKSIDGARQFRGIQFADLLIAALAGEGKIVTGKGSEGSTGVNLTPSVKEAAKFALEASDGEGTDDRTFARFVQALHLTPEESAEVNDIIYAPVVLRFDRDKLEAKRRRGEISKPFYTGSYQNVEPYLTVHDLTDECVEHIKGWSGIDIIKLADDAQKF